MVHRGSWRPFKLPLGFQGAPGVDLGRVWAQLLRSSVFDALYFVWLTVFGTILGGLFGITIDVFGDMFSDTFEEPLRMCFFMIPRQC